MTVSVFSAVFGDGTGEGQRQSLLKLTVTEALLLNLMTYTPTAGTYIPLSPVNSYCGCEYDGMFPDDDGPGWRVFPGV